MIICSIRSSVLNCVSICEQQYFLGYVLGLYQKSNRKAQLGSALHKVMECVANCKKAQQDNQLFVEDKDIGDITHIEKINEPDYINSLVDRSFAFYMDKGDHIFTTKDHNEIKSWTWKVLNWNGGMFDPRKRKIVAAEQHFNFVVNEDWAHFDYPEINIKGQLSLKGTVDLITQVRDDVYEIVDYKSGKQINWQTGQKKTYDDLIHDIQPCFYHYCLYKMYPNIKQFILTFFYVNFDGPISLIFEEKDKIKTEQRIKDYFTRIKSITKPRLKSENHTHFWCTKVCHFGKTQSDKDPTKNVCAYIRDKVKEIGMNRVVQTETNPKFNLNEYVIN